MGQLAKSFCDKSNLTPSLVAWHGHTIFHDPAEQATCQIGHGAAIAAQVERPVVCQFRQMDMVLGGQGAPLAPLADQHLLPEADYYVNLGGICNISFLSGGIRRSFDICACNQLLDKLAQELNLTFDPEGSIAASGHLHTDLLGKLNAWPYLQRTPPKSLDNSQVMSDLWSIIQSCDATIPDKLHTTTKHIAQQIASIILRYRSQKGVTANIAISGGGAFNVFLLQQLRSALSEISFEFIPLSPELIAFKEAALMGLMGFLFIHGITNVISSSTGASDDHVGGCLYQNWKAPATINV